MHTCLTKSLLLTQVCFDFFLVWFVFICFDRLIYNCRSEMPHWKYRRWGPLGFGRLFVTLKVGRKWKRGEKILMRILTEIKRSRKKSRTLASFRLPLSPGTWSVLMGTSCFLGILHYFSCSVLRTYTGAVDNGPARNLSVSHSLQKYGDVWGEPLEMYGLVSFLIA